MRKILVSSFTAFALMGVGGSLTIALADDARIAPQIVPFDGTTGAASGGIVPNRHDRDDHQGRYGRWNGGHDKGVYNRDDSRYEGNKGRHDNDDYRSRDRETRGKYDNNGYSDRDAGRRGNGGYGQGGGWDYGRGGLKIKPL